jgi:hypothetical protein
VRKTTHFHHFLSFPLIVGDSEPPISKTFQKNEHAPPMAVSNFFRFKNGLIGQRIFKNLSIFGVLRGNTHK